MESTLLYENRTVYYKPFISLAKLLSFILLE